MWKSALAVSHMLAHQEPSFHQSLLSGLEPVGAEPEPTDEGPSKPMSPGAAVACAGRAKAASRPASRTTDSAARRRTGARHLARGRAALTSPGITGSPARVKQPVRGARSPGRLLVQIAELPQACLEQLFLLGRVRGLDGGGLWSVALHQPAQ